MSEEHRHLHSVIDVARTIAEAASGSGDWIMPTDERIAWLTQRVQSGWQEPSSSYDCAVRTMAMCSLNAYAATLDRVYAAGVAHQMMYCREDTSDE